MVHRLLNGATPVEQEKEKKDDYWRPEYHVAPKIQWVRTESNDRAARSALDECMRIIKKNPSAQLPKG